MTTPEQVPEEDVPAEDGLTALWLAALTVWLGLVLPAVMAPTLSGGLPDPSAMWRYNDVWVAQVDRIMPILARLARPGWARTAQALGVRLPWDPRDPYLLENLAQARNLLVRIPEETYQQVVKAMVVGADNGESRAQIAARVNNILNINGSENWPHRASVIARTELNRFREAGGLAAAQRIQTDEGSVIRKRWQDRDDTRVRSSHARVDNQLRRLGEPFEVGRSMLQHPVDPSGFPEDVINCRCELDYVRGA